MRQLLRRVWYAIRRRRLDDELAEEMAFHRAMTQREIEARGIEPTEAAFATRRAFGSTALAWDQARDVWMPRSLQGLGQDCRLAIRTLFTNQLGSAVAIVSLALGIGANTAIFSVVNSLLLRALPVVDPRRLAILSTSSSLSVRTRYSYATFDQIRQYGRSFDGALAYSCCGKSTLTFGGENESVDHLWVSGMILLGAALTLSAVGVLAGGVPAYRASRIDPAEVLTES